MAYGKRTYKRKAIRSYGWRKRGYAKKKMTWVKGHYRKAFPAKRSYRRRRRY